MQPAAAIVPVVFEHCMVMLEGAGTVLAAIKFGIPLPTRKVVSLSHENGNFFQQQQGWTLNQRN